MSTPTKVATMTPLGASTPKDNVGAPAPTESPGNWRHPKLSEISRRKVASTFGERNIRRIAWNVAVLLGLWAAAQLLQRYTPVPRITPPSWKVYVRYAYLLAQVVPLVNVAIAVLPLVRKEDDFADIALTAGQRKLLGLPPASAPASPNVAFSTPPRYSRTPSVSGSVGSRSAYAGSPLSGRGSPAPAASPSPVTFSPTPTSPLFQKATNGSGPRRSSFGSPSPLGVSTSSSLFPESPSPTPAGVGKRSSVGLNNKWLYDRGRRASGQSWYT